MKAFNLLREHTRAVHVVGTVISSQYLDQFTIRPQRKVAPDQVDEVLPCRVIQQLFHAQHLGVDDGDFAPAHVDRWRGQEHVVQTAGDRFQRVAEFGGRLGVDVDAVDVVRAVDEPQQALRLLDIHTHSGGFKLEGLVDH